MTDPGHLRCVVLRNVPARTLLAADDHVSELVREFKLIRIGLRTGTSDGTPVRLLELIEEVLRDYGDVLADSRRQAELAAASGQDTVTVRLWLPSDAGASLVRFLELLDEADRYCRAEELLALAAPPEVVELRHWYTKEIVRQLLAPSA